jgi:nicotinate-nucleotide adenylyltransferase
VCQTVPRSFGSIKVNVPLTAPGLRVGVMGGTFNPPHDGHVLISHTAIRRLGLDELWWVVTPGNPLKNNEELPPLAERMELCRNLAGDSRIIVTGFEEDLSTPYTAVTLAFLKQRHPGTRFVWVMGADNLASFHRWQRWRAIAEMMPIAVVDRPGWRHRALAEKTAKGLQKWYVPERFAGLLPYMQAPAWTLLTGPLSPLSSTELRRRATEPAEPAPAPRILEFLKFWK